MSIWNEKDVQVNIPFRMLFETFLDRFLKHQLNPEIGLDADCLDSYALSDFSKIAAALKKSGLTVTLHAPFMDLSPGSPDAAIRRVARRRFEQLLELVPVFKPKAIVCHSGYDRKRYWYDRDGWIDKSLEMWRWLAAGIRKTGAVLMIENVYEHNPEEMLVLFERLGDQRVRFCLDIGHQHVFSKSPLEKWIKILGPQLGQLHLHDNDGSQDSHLALGRGTIDLPKLFRLLKTVVTDSTLVTLEPHKEGDLWPSIEYLKKHAFK